ncbi:MAG: hypothetical protein LBJ37_19070 [Paucimonas sp.]|jgi:hypothetical protein|nr:hypothetical protein [Paucimonas sp.]
MSFDFRHWLALACLLPALVFFAISYDMPLFNDPARLRAIHPNEKGTDYSLKKEQFDQAVSEELTPRLKHQDRALCFLMLAFLVLQVPRRLRSIAASRARLLAYGCGVVIVFPVLAIDQVQRNHERGLFPEWSDSLGPLIVMTMVLDVLFLLILAPFLYRTWRGLQGAGKIFKGAAAVLGLASLVLAARGLWSGDYVLLATEGLQTLFFAWFLLGTLARR